MECTEISGEEVSREQLERMLRRYYWAGRFCAGKDVVEVACGTGQGLEYLASISKSLHAGDISPAMVKIAQVNAPQQVRIQVMDAHCMPFENRCMDIVILFEAIYYLAHPESFLAECKRILRPGGKILISSANKDLFDFTPSPYSFNYYGTREFYDFFKMNGFKIKLFGDTRLQRIQLRQKVFRPIKKLATKLNLIPKSMESKRLIKRIIFGKMIEMPNQIWPSHNDWIEPDELLPDRPAFDHKVLFCEAMVLNNDYELTP
jgi:ubiquinone/menaquinone biosynthesis C-methylase UbiE